MGCLVELMSYVFFSQKPPRVPRSSYTVPTSSGFEISGSSSELAIEMALATGYLDFSVLYQIHDLGRSEYLLSLRIMSGRDSKTSLSSELLENICLFSFSSSYVHKRSEGNPPEDRFSFGCASRAQGDTRQQLSCEVRGDFQASLSG